MTVRDRSRTASDLYGFLVSIIHWLALRLRCATLRASETTPLMLSVAARAGESKHAGMDKHHRESVFVAAFASLVALGTLASCDRLPGQPALAERWVPTTEVTDFSRLYAQNCSGCHGADGRLGAAHPLNDPLYLALIGEDALRGVVARGVPGTGMPAFAQAAGGSLTDQQIDLLVKEMRARWARPEEFKNVVFPPYSVQEATAMGSGPGDVQRGAVTYATYCAQCHGADGSGAKGGSVTDPAYLALASDQALRTAVIAGRSDLGKPDWRTNLPDRPMSPQDISDVVAWLVSHRATGQGETRRTAQRE